ncbi:MAG: helix-turn-helix domain-containing protein [Firmicutes bacterium]|nr:helix-turn-helix domain-containing protein [Bacillota bacterium]
MIEKLILKTKEEIKTMTDPYRVDIIQVFRKNNNTSLTVKDISNELNEPHGKIYYHIKKLEKIGALTLDHTENINGITAKYYRLNFKEMAIKHKEKDLNKELELNHTLNMISKFYDDSKNSFISNLKNVEEYEDQSFKTVKKECRLTSSNLYFTKESYEEFFKELDDLIKKYSKEQKCNEEFKKTLFLSIYSE